MLINVCDRTHRGSACGFLEIWLHVQLTLVISSWLISNNRLSRSENLVIAYACDLELQQN